MAEYGRKYMQEHCIDVYFRYGSRPFHVLTYGTIIPAILNDVGRNRSLQHQVAVDVEKPGFLRQVIIEHDYVNDVRDASKQASGDKAKNEQLIPDEETILQMFKPNAELGFYSYDCIEELPDGRGLYRLVAYSSAGINDHKYANLPELDELEVVEYDEKRGVIMKFSM